MCECGKMVYEVIGDGGTSKDRAMRSAAHKFLSHPSYHLTGCPAVPVFPQQLGDPTLLFPIKKGSKYLQNPRALTTRLDNHERLSEAC